MSRYRQRLVEEISFWRTLMHESELSDETSEYQRMRYALQFAEFRLANHERAMTVRAEKKLEH